MIFLMLTGCEEQPEAFFLHESVNTRMRESHSLLPYYYDLHYTDTATLRFAAFSDIHITDKNENLFCSFEVDIPKKKIDFFLVAGDLTDHGQAMEFDTCLSDLMHTGIPWFLTIGNHDMYQKNSWNIWKDYFGPSCYTVVLSGKIRLIFLDTSTGSIGKDQFRWLEQVLKESVETFRIVISHYPLFDDPFPSIYRLPGAEERYKLLHLFYQYNVYAYVSGHLHTFQHKEINGIQHFIVGAMNPHKLDKGRHGYLLFTLKEDTLSWEWIPIP